MGKDKDKKKEESDSSSDSGPEDVSSVVKLKLNSYSSQKFIHIHDKTFSLLYVGEKIESSPDYVFLRLSRNHFTSKSFRIVWIP